MTTKSEIENTIANAVYKAKARALKDFAAEMEEVINEGSYGLFDSNQVIAIINECARIYELSYLRMIK